MRSARVSVTLVALLAGRRSSRSTIWGTSASFEGRNRSDTVATAKATR